MSRFLYLYVVCCFFFKNEKALAQSPMRHCGTDDMYQKALVQNPDYAIVRSDLEQFTARWIKENQGTSTQREQISIPVVVHVVWNEAIEDISEDQIYSQLAVLNADFRAKNTDINTVPDEFSPFVADIGIEFCLATIDPEGNPTTGITRRFTSFTAVGLKFAGQEQRRVKHTNLGGQDAWDTKQYLNIWVGAGDLTIFGDATFPGQTHFDEEGVFIDYRFFGTSGTAANNVPYHLGRTCTHEVAHYLNVQHLWGTSIAGCDEDGVADTPSQAGPTINCPTHPSITCNSPDMFMNFMDYVPDACMHFFTTGQKWRMLAALNGPRSALLTSNGCGNGSEAIPSILADTYTVYPNPTANILNIYVANSNQLESLTLFSLDGKIVEGPPFLINGKLHQLDLTPVPAGIYILHIRQYAESKYEKIIISK